MAVQDPNIRAATFSPLDAHGNILNNDYIIVGPDQSSVVPSFLPEAQTLEFIFTLFPDDIAEDTEAFHLFILINSYFLAMKAYIYI